MKYLYAMCMLLLFVHRGNTQTVQQTIKGRILDADSRHPLIGVTVMVGKDSIVVTGSQSDADGYFETPPVAVGRYRIVARYVGYHDFSMPVTVISGKETDIQIEMQEAPSFLKEVVVSGKVEKAPLNEMITLSSRVFDASETERYAGSRMDPARMASNYAGIQGTDDSRNDIVVRGNSPLGVVYRVEGVDVFNPNHFAVAGSAGGPISMLNNKLIGNSDFITGAFPSDYGNTVSGVFDIRFRNGNKDKHRFSALFGLFGTELFAEGPINRQKQSTYIVGYRYSTLAMFGALNINLGTQAVPNYQDLSFKINLPMKNDQTLSFFGMGGYSKIDIEISTYPFPSKDLYAIADRDQYFRTGGGTLGVNYKKLIRKKGMFSLTLAQSYQLVKTNHDLIFRDSVAPYNVTQLMPILGTLMNHHKTSAHILYNHKINARNTYRAGVIVERYQIGFDDSTRNESSGVWTLRMNDQAEMYMLRSYVSYKYLLNSRTRITAGLHAMHFTQHPGFWIEPRAGIDYTLSDKSALSLGYGLHSQIQPLYVYYNRFTDSLSKTFAAHNRQIGPNRSHHIVLGYSRQLRKTLKLRGEVYYQYLFNVPVERISSSFSLLNQGAGFQRFFSDVLQNTGTGENYGVEVSLEKGFTNNLFYMFNIAVFDSKYKGSDGISRNTDFNGNFASNLLMGYEKPFGKDKNNTLITGTKITYAGGRRYSPVDTAATRAIGNEIVFVNAERNSLQFREYFRFDVRIGFRWNRKRISHEFILDLVNVTNQKNVLTLNYVNDPDNPGTKIISEQYQLGRLPVFSYKIDF